MIWNQQVEMLSRADMTAWQSYKLVKLIERVYEKSILYKSRMNEYELLPEKIANLNELKRLPVTTKQDITANYPYGLLTMPVSGVSYIHTSQDGKKPAAMSYTRNDMGMWSELMSRILVAGGVNVTSIFQWAGIMEEHIPSIGISSGIQRIGATLLPECRSSKVEQLRSIEDFGVTSIFSTACYLLQLACEASSKGYKPTELPLQNIFCDANFVSQNQSDEIEQVYGRKPNQVYGIYDIWGMGIAGECHCNAGLHIQEDCFYPEIIHPKSGQVLPIGETGELLLTSLTLEAMPLLRFCTGIICSLDDSPCACGRTLIRMRKSAENNCS